MKSKSKVLVAYYSRTGHTERAAKDLSIALNADIEKITDKTNRKGILGYIFGGRDALTKRKTGIEKFIHNPIHYSLIIIGTPIWRGNITPAVRTYIGKVKQDIKNYAFFITSGNTDSEKIINPITEIIHKKPIAHAGFNSGEQLNKEIYNKKLAAFVNDIKKQLK